MPFIQYPTEILGIPIETDYTFWLRYVARILDSREITDQEKIDFVVRNVFGKDAHRRENAPELFLGCLDFYHCGKDADRFPRAEEVQLHWENDGLAILGDFFVYARIDLDDGEPMHWWKFHAIFESLPSESRIKSLMQIRGIDPSDYKGDAKGRAKMAEHKRMAAVWLPDDDYEPEFMSREVE